MMKLNDLSPEDRESLMNEMRDIIEKENLDKDATAMYAIKKKELVNNTMKELYSILKLNHAPEQSRARDRFISMTNYLFGLNQKVQPSQVKIRTASDWELYEKICKNVMTCMIHCVRWEG